MNTFNQPQPVLSFLKNKKERRKLLALFYLLLSFSYGAISQNVSYNLNSIPITLGTNNSAFGFQALTSLTFSAANDNSAFGYHALFSNSAGSLNTAIGSKALSGNLIGGNNTAVGSSALFTNINGAWNTAVGLNALLNNSNGNYNTANGGSALSGNTSGSYNTANGMISLLSNSTGNSNTGDGYGSLGGNTIGNYNTAVGYRTLIANTTGTNNTAFGYQADVASNNLTNATAIGNSAIVNASNTIQLGNSAVTKIFAGTGNTCTLISGGLQITGGVLGAGKVLTSDASGVATWQTPSGSGSGWSLIGNTGTIDGTNFLGTIDDKPFNIRVFNLKAGRIDRVLENVFYGLQSGNNNTTAFENTAIGDHALFTNQLGFGNTAIGYKTLYFTAGGIGGVGGTGNSAVGNYALYNNTTGIGNTALGYSALYNTTTSLRNTGIGGDALFYNTIGTDNTAIGNNALSANISGNNNTGLGQYATVSTGPVLNNATAVGSQAIVNASNKVRLGSTTVTVVEGPVAYTFSDGRFKNNISETDVKGLEFIKLLRPVVYNLDTRKIQEFLTQNMPDSASKVFFENKDFRASTSIRQSGFIAQEVEQAAKKVGYNFNGVHVPESNLDNYSLAYSEFVVPLVKAVQELSKQNENLKKEMDELKALIKANTYSEGSIKINGSSEAKLFQNAPNPFNKSTIIKYSIPFDAKNAVISIRSVDGNKVKDFNLKTGGQSIEIGSGQLAAGIYTYSLILDDKLIDTKQMILTY